MPLDSIPSNSYVIATQQNSHQHKRSNENERKFPNETINSLEKRLANLPQGDAVVFDLDNTLLHHPVGKSGARSPELRESGMAALLSQLIESGHPVILVNSRDNEPENTVKQLKTLGLEYSALLHVAGHSSHNKKELLIEHFNKQNYTRVLVFDNCPSDLETIEQDSTDTMAIRFYRYQATAKLLASESANFPDDLAGLSEPKSLGGGSKSTYCCRHDSGRTFVLKHGANQEQIKVEILINRLYRALGVPVPEVQAYNHMPESLAKSLDLPHTALTAQLATFIEQSKETESSNENIIKQARDNFIIHAFLGNIDVAKCDNFILDKTNKAIMIDAGANFIFRALGEFRDESVAKVSELHSMRDEENNTKASKWFASLSEDEIKSQVSELLAKRDIIEGTVWTISSQLQLSTRLQQAMLDGLSHRLNYLARQYGLNTQRSAMRPLSSYAKVKFDIVDTMVKKSAVLDEIKQIEQVKTKAHILIPEDEEHKSNHQLLTQSEMHLRKVMGDEYIEDHGLKENIETFVRQHFTKLSKQQQAQLSGQAFDMIEHEREHPEQVFFYHGVDSSIAYAYQIYSELYKILTADKSHDFFRTDNALFHRCLNVQEFIAHFQRLSKSDMVDNYTEGYMECGLSTNLFIFGNHNAPTSNTLEYYTSNSTKATIDVVAMFQASLGTMGISDSLIKRIVDLLDEDPNKGQGALYQVGLETDVVDDYTYAAGSLGILKNLKLNSRDTVRISDVLEQIRQDNVSTDYIQTLQARLFIPPNTPITTVQSRRWNNESTNQVKDKIFNHHVELLAQSCAKEILNNYNPYRKLNSHLPLSRQIPHVMKQAGLVVDSGHVSDELIIQLVEIGDFDSISAIVRQYPEYKYKTLHSRDISYTDGIDNTSEKDKNAKSHLFDLLLGIEEAGPCVREIFGEKFYQGKLDTLNFAKVLLTLDKSRRLRFLNENKAHLKDFKAIIDVVKVFPIEQRLILFEGCNGTIATGDELATVLAELPQAIRLNLAKSYQEKIANGFQLASVLKTLPEALRLNFAISCDEKISNGRELASVVGALPDDTRLAFGDRCKDRVKDCSSLVAIIGRLPDSAQLDFCKNHLGKIQSCRDLSDVLAQLEGNAQLNFAIKFKNECITHMENGHQLSYVLARVSKSVRHEFAKKFKQKIVEYDDLVNTIELLDEEYLLEFAMENKDKIKNIYHLCELLNYLPVTVFLKFVKVCDYKISTTGDLLGLLKKLPENVRYQLAIDNKDIIKNDTKGWLCEGEQLSKVVAVLAEDERLALAGITQDKIEDGEQLAAVLAVLPAAARLVFATANRAKIKDSELSMIAKLLSEDECLQFMSGSDDASQVSDSTIEETRPMEVATNLFDSRSISDESFKNDSNYCGLTHQEGIQALKDTLAVLREKHTNFATKSFQFFSTRHCFLDNIDKIVRKNSDYQSLKNQVSSYLEKVQTLNPTGSTKIILDELSTFLCEDIPPPQAAF